MPPVTPSTPKSERTRQRILEVALALFSEKGFAATTMRDIAAAADVSLGLTYRYFARKEDLAVALYEGMSARLQDTAAGLYGGTVASRFGVLMQATIDHLDQHREPFLAVAARAFDPRDDLGVLGVATEPFREAARATWEIVVTGADDAPRDAEERARLADVLYALNLLVVLIWTQDRDPSRGATYEAIIATTQLLGAARPLLATPFGAIALSQAASIAGKLGIGRTPEGAGGDRASSAGAGGGEGARGEGARGEGAGDRRSRGGGAEAGDVGGTRSRGGGAGGPGGTR